MYNSICQVGTLHWRNILQPCTQNILKLVKKYFISDFEMHQTSLHTKILYGTYIYYMFCCRGVKNPTKKNKSGLKPITQ